MTTATLTIDAQSGVPAGAPLRLAPAPTPAPRRTPPAPHTAQAAPQAAQPQPPAPASHAPHTPPPAPRRRMWPGWAALGRVILISIAVTLGGAGSLAIAVGAFALSFDAIEAVGVSANMNPDLAWLLPVSVDGLITVAIVSTVLLRVLRRATWYPWLVVVYGAVVSVLCNAAHAVGDGSSVRLTEMEARLVSAIPPICLALAVHLVVTLVLALLEPDAPRRTLAQRISGAFQRITAAARRSHKPAPVTPPRRVRAPAPTPPAHKPAAAATTPRAATPRTDDAPTIVNAPYPASDPLAKWPHREWVGVTPIVNHAVTAGLVDPDDDKTMRRLRQFADLYGRIGHKVPSGQELATAYPEVTKSQWNRDKKTFVQAVTP